MCNIKTIVVNDNVCSQCSNSNTENDSIPLNGMKQEQEPILSKNKPNCSTKSSQTLVSSNLFLGSNKNITLESGSKDVKELIGDVDLNHNRVNFDTKSSDKSAISKHLSPHRSKNVEKGNKFDNSQTFNVNRSVQFGNYNTLHLILNIK